MVHLPETQRPFDIKATPAGSDYLIEVSLRKRFGRDEVLGYALADEFTAYETAEKLLVDARAKMR